MSNPQLQMVIRPETIDDFTYGLDLISSPAQIPRGGSHNMTNFHPRAFGLERKSGYRLVSAGIAGADIGSLEPDRATYGIATSSGTDSEFAVLPENDVTAREVFNASAVSRNLHGAFTRRDPDTGTLELYVNLGVNFYKLQYVNRAWESILLTDGTDPVEDGVDLGRPKVLFANADALGKYHREKKVTFTWFRGELWIARRGYPMRRYRPDKNLFYAAPVDAPRPAVLATYEGFLIGADLGAFSYTDSNSNTVNVPEDPNGLRWSARFNSSQWDDTVSVSAGFKIPSQCHSRILAACATADELVFFHEDEIHSQRYVGGGDIFRTRTITTETGVLSPTGIVCSLQRVLFLGKDNIYILSGGEIAPIDSNRHVRDEIFSLDPETIRLAVAHYDRRNQEVYWYFPAPDPIVYVFNIPLVNWARLTFDNRFYNRFPVKFIDLPITPQNNFHFLGSDGSIYDVRLDDYTEGGAAFNSTYEFVTDLGTRQVKVLYQVEISAAGTGKLTLGYAATNNSELDSFETIYKEVEVEVDKGNHRKIPLVNCAGATGRFFAIRLSTADALLIRSFSLKYDIEGIMQGGS